MDNLINILDSFQPSWKERPYVDHFIQILRELVIPNYPFMEAKIENSKATSTKEWNQIVSSLKEAQIFNVKSAQGGIES